MQERSLPIYDQHGKEVDSVKLDPGVFDGKVNRELIYQIVNVYRASARSGLAATKTRGEVSGGGRKPWKQKGTGRARVGSIRSPLWRHGGVVFGPHPRDFSFSVSETLKRQALKSALNAKLNEGKITVISVFELGGPKTKLAAKVFDDLKLTPAKKKKKPVALFLMRKIDPIVKRATGNLDFLDINSADYTFAYEVLAHANLLITKDALADITKRLKR